MIKKLLLTEPEMGTLSRATYSSDGRRFPVCGASVYDRFGSPPRRLRRGFVPALEYRAGFCWGLTCPPQRKERTGEDFLAV